MKKVIFTSLAILILSTASTFASSNVEESKMTKTNYEFTGKTSDNIYLRFAAPSNFSGKID